MQNCFSIYLLLLNAITQQHISVIPGREDRILRMMHHVFVAIFKKLYFSSDAKLLVEKYGIAPISFVGMKLLELLGFKFA